MLCGPLFWKFFELSANKIEVLEKREIKKIIDALKNALFINLSPPNFIVYFEKIWSLIIGFKESKTD